MDDSEYPPEDAGDCERLLIDDKEVSVQQGKRNCTEEVIAAKH
jgi:hypothetical protein